MKKKKNRVKEVKKAIGRLKVPPPQVIPDKRDLIKEQEAKKDIEREN